MRTRSFEQAHSDAGLFLALLRGRIAAPGAVSLGEGVRAATERTLDRTALVDAILRGAASLGPAAEEHAARSASRLRQDGVVAVVAGQQPVLFGGPHLVWSKALAAVALARRIEAAGVPAVPVWWSATEDHDHAESCAVQVLDGTGGVRSLAATLPGGRRMLSRVPLPSTLGAQCAELAASLPDGPGREAVMSRWTPRAGDATWGTWVTRGVAETFGRFGLVVVEPEWLRSAARRVAEFDAAAPGRLVAEIGAMERAIAVGHGFPPPLALRGPHVCFVVGRDGTRHRADAASLAAALRRGPEHVSWDVAGRVLAQSEALPVAAQVCGPAEYAYVSMTSAAHHALGLSPPHAAARPGVTFSEAPERPGGVPQERALSILSFVARHGEAMLDRMLDAFADPSLEHAVLSPEDLA